MVCSMPLLRFSLVFTNGWNSTDPGSERVRDMLEKEYVKVECLWDERISRSSEMYLRRLVGS